jgi:hypothetical protein
VSEPHDASFVADVGIDEVEALAHAARVCQ